MVLQKIYALAPIWVQHCMASVSGFQRNRSRYGQSYWAHREWLVDFDSWSLDRKAEYQDMELSRFVSEAVARSGFYRVLYESVEIGSVLTVADLPQLPVVDKEMLRANMERIYTIPRRGAVEGHTGGTTGKSLVVRMTPEDMMKRMAALDHFKSRAGFEHRKMRRATFNGKHIVPHGSQARVYWRYNAACKQMMYSTFHMTESNLGKYVESLNRFKPKALDGFFTSMVDVANYIERNEINVEFSPIAIFPTSETVTEAGREVLERVFKTKVYDQYASSEGAPFVFECNQGTLHVDHSSGVFERTETGEVLVTSFTTLGTPLIRYAIGDAMDFAQETKCICGVDSEIISKISGRKDDFLYTALGVKINGGNVANLFKNMPNALVRAQAIQTRLDEIEISLEVDKSLYRESYDHLLREEFTQKFGPQTRLLIKHVDSIPREASGKHRLIRNLIAEGVVKSR